MVLPLRRCGHPRAEETGEGLRKNSWVPAMTLIMLLVPLMELLTVSVAVKVGVPTVISLAMNVPMPLVRVELAGRTTQRSGSELLNFTIPPYSAAGVPQPSLPATVKFKQAPPP